MSGLSFLNLILLMLPIDSIAVGLVKSKIAFIDVVVHFAYFADIIKLDLSVILED